MDSIGRELQDIPRELRRKIMAMIYRAGGGHIAPAFSIVEILTALYFRVMRYDPKRPDLPERDRFVLSKGHASAALYAVLAQAGFFEESILDSYCRPGSILGGHPDMYKVPGVEASTGALGHGFPFAVGIALAGKMERSDYRVFVVVGDGECQEGTIWEAAAFASHHRLGRLTVIVDYNKIQAMDRLDWIVGVEPFAEKWRAFGWDVVEVDGHDISALVSVLGRESFFDAPPRLVLAHTVKGKGVSFMENEPLWHYRLPNEQEMKIVCTELELTV